MMSLRAVGRWTLTTTRSPPVSVARWTSAMVPAAIGSGTIDSNTSSHGTPSSCSITCTTSSCVSGGTLSCSVASSLMNAGGSRSGRVESICPSFAKVGPSSSSAWRKRRARCSVESSSPRRPRENSSRTPCLASTAEIVLARPSR